MFSRTSTYVRRMISTLDRNIPALVGVGAVTGGSVGAVNAAKENIRTYGNNANVNANINLFGQTWVGMCIGAMVAGLSPVLVPMALFAAAITIPARVYTSVHTSLTGSTRP